LLTSASHRYAAILDRDKLTAVTAGDAHFMNELLQLYVASAAETLAELQAAQDRTALCKAAHKLKGASANIHAERVRDVCALLESQGMTMEASQLSVQLNQLQQAVAAVAQEVSKLLRGDESAA
jgi:two-component system, sensor histidine kinase and response regulator